MTDRTGRQTDRQRSDPLMPSLLVAGDTQKNSLWSKELNVMSSGKRYFIVEQSVILDQLFFTLLRQYF